MSKFDAKKSIRNSGLFNNGAIIIGLSEGEVSFESDTNSFREYEQIAEDFEEKLLQQVDSRDESINFSLGS